MRSCQFHKLLPQVLGDRGPLIGIATRQRGLDLLTVEQLDDVMRVLPSRTQDTAKPDRRPVRVMDDVAGQQIRVSGALCDLSRA